MTSPRGDSLILIGMPGSGKSTLGVLLAKELAKRFVDTDLLIQEQEGRTLQEIVNRQGYETLRQVEEQVLLATAFDQHIVATGGSAVYSEAAMRHLQAFGRLVFLETPLHALRQRVTDYGSRGIAAPAGQSLEQLMAEREQLYRQYADMTVSTADKTPAQLVSEIVYQEAESYADVDA